MNPWDQLLTTRMKLLASVIFASDLYAEMERIADETKVSFFWSVRDAVEKSLIPK